MEAVKMVFDGFDTRLLSELKDEISNGTSPTCKISANGRVISGVGEHDPFDAILLPEPQKAGDFDEVVTKRGTRHYRLPKPSEEWLFKVQIPRAHPAPVRPVTVEFEILDGVRIDLQCMDLFTKLLESHSFKQLESTEHHYATIQWMLSEIHRVRTQLAPTVE
jgi:hypothetical protein